MTYKPNFEDPRVRRRTQRALDFVYGCFSDKKSRSWSTRDIDRHFGQQQHQLSQWLRSQLLVVADANYNYLQGQCKRYQLNRAGYQSVQQQLGIPAQRTQWAAEQFQDELSQRQFTYRDLNNRLWHPLQNLRREAKQATLYDSGFRYQYDIQCCAPHLLWQHSYLDQREPWTEVPQYIDAYVQNRSQIRQQISHSVQLDTSAVKVIINALFSGARLGCNRDFALYQMLEYDQARMRYLQQDPFISGLRQDIRVMWRYIAPSMQRRTRLDQNNQQRLLPISSREKWSRYFELERAVLNRVIEYFNLRDIEFFAEHDGWTTVQELDECDLRDFVRTKTGYDIKLDREILQGN